MDLNLEEKPLKSKSQNPEMTDNQEVPLPAEVVEIEMMTEEEEVIEIDLILNHLNLVK
jgi:hypothetical protein